MFNVLVYCISVVVHAVGTSHLYDNDQKNVGFTKTHND